MLKASYKNFEPSFRRAGPAVRSFRTPWYLWCPFSPLHPLRLQPSAVIASCAQMLAYICPLSNSVLWALVTNGNSSAWGQWTRNRVCSSWTRTSTTVGTSSTRLTHSTLCSIKYVEAFLISFQPGWNLRRVHWRMGREEGHSRPSLHRNQGMSTIHNSEAPLTAF